MSLRCHVCARRGLRPLAGSRKLRRITSDCKPWSQGYDLLACPGCGLLQTRIDSVWLRDIEKIYRTYAIYPQTKGNHEQKVVVRAGTSPQSRSRVIANDLSKRKFFGSALNILEVGAGAGFLLKEIRKKAPEAQLFAVEKSPACIRAIRRSGAVAGIFQELDQVKEKMDRILLVHTLEHIPFPCGFLETLRLKMAKDGKLFIQVPNTPSNSFLLAVADHCSHFHPESLINCLAWAGWQPEKVWLSMGGKEISGIFRAGKTLLRRSRGRGWGIEILRHLGRVEKTFRNLSGPVHVFGSSLGGTWLAAGHHSKIKDFLDEDSARVGSKFMRIPVRHPNQADRDIPLFSTVRFTASNGLKKKLQPFRILKAG